MTIGSIDLKLRPVKIGILVTPTDRESVQKAIHFNSLLWGGMFNPLIPCYKKLPKHWEDLKDRQTTATKVVSGYINGFDPDYLVNLSQLATESIDFARDRVVTLEEVLSGFAEDSAPKLGAGIFEVIEQFRHDELRFLRREEPSFIKPVFNSDQSLFLHSFFGDIGNYEEDLYEKYLHDIDFAEVNVDEKSYWKYFSAEYLFSRRIGAFYLKQRLSGPVLFYMDASKILDVIDYWNLRAAGWEVYPVTIQAEEENGLQKICKNIIDRAYVPYRFNKNLYHHCTIIKSRNLQFERLSEFHRKLDIKSPSKKKGPKVTLQRWYPRIWKEWARQNTDEIITPAFSNEEKIELQEGQEELRFRTLDPEFELFHVNSNYPRFALEVDSRVYGSSELSADVIPMGGDAVSRAIDQYSIREWRISRTGPVYLSNYQNWNVNYKIPKAEPIVMAWFEEKGWKVELSTSGKVASQMIKQLGGPWGIVQLKEEKLIKLLQELSNDSCINEQEFKNRVAQITNSDDVWTSRDEYIKRLLEKEIFQLGIELQCPVCSQRSWYSLARLDATVKCDRCISDYKVQSIDSGSKRWAYKSFGTFGLPRQAYGAYAVLLTIHALTSNGRERATVLPSFLAKKNGREIEADLCMFTEREFRDKTSQQLVFSECKSYNNFFRKDVERMGSLAAEFPGAVLVFSTLRPELTAAEKRLLRPLVNRGRRYWKEEKTYNPVVVLTGNELFSSRGIPHCWKEQGGKAQEFADKGFYPRDLVDLADATQQIYLDMKPYHEWREERWMKRQKVA